MQNGEGEGYYAAIQKDPKYRKKDPEYRSTLPGMIPNRLFPRSYRLNISNYIRL